MSTEKAEPDPLSVFDDMAAWFETLRGMIAAHVAEGFTQEQARELVVYVITHAGSAS